MEVLWHQDVVDMEYAVVVYVISGTVEHVRALGLEKRHRHRGRRVNPGVEQSPLPVWYRQWRPGVGQSPLLGCYRHEGNHMVG